MHVDTSQHRPVLALLIRLGAIAALSTMAALVKLLSERELHLVEILFWRQFLSLPVLLAWVMLLGGGLADFATKRPRNHLRRGLYGLAGMVLNFGAVILLPLAEATTLNFTAPIWAVILSALILRERVGVWRWSAVATGFAGILVITQPGGSSLPLFGALVGLGAAFMIALISIQIADLGRTEKPVTIVFWFAVTSSAVLFVPMLFFTKAHDGTTWALLGLLGLTGTIGQMLLTAALKYGPVSSVVVMDYSALFWATLFGWYLFDRLPPSSTWLGAPLVVAAGVVIAWREHRLGRLRRGTLPPPVR